MSHVHLDYFGSDLGEMKAKDKRSDEAVLAVLRRSPRFSDFDVDAAIARTLDRLYAKGRIVYDQSLGYPWTIAIVLPPPIPCEPCGGLGYVGWRGRNRLGCTACEARGWNHAPPDSLPANPRPPAARGTPNPHEETTHGE